MGYIELYKIYCWKQFGGSIMKNTEKKSNMVAYEFYSKDGSEIDSLIGILPERRRDKKRVTEKSIMKWGMLAAGINVDPNSIWYVKVNLS